MRDRVYHNSFKWILLYLPSKAQSVNNNNKATCSCVRTLIDNIFDAAKSMCVHESSIYSLTFFVTRQLSYAAAFPGVGGRRRIDPLL